MKTEILTPYGCKGMSGEMTQYQSPAAGNFFIGTVTLWWQLYFTIDTIPEGLIQPLIS